MNTNNYKLLTLAEDFINAKAYELNIENGKVNSTSWDITSEPAVYFSEFLNILETLELNLTCMQFERLKCNTVSTVNAPNTTFSFNTDKDYVYQCSILDIFISLIEEQKVVSYDTLKITINELQWLKNN